ncbi:unnamed protein product [Rotaria socialis]|uniref:Uncharacterized protein n=1 Tax=Rotaria socialis TaxID=392032 RepID=A0A817M182_9BILA|nr:unnamed protein product [Rotaria socialis]CAF4470396.1 unnamed protein product [Rotaria socialis]
MSIDLTGDNAIPDLPNASSSASCPIPAQSSSTQVTYTSTNIKHGLRHDKSHYKILSNPSKRATASCWAKFSLPAVRISDEKEAIFSIIKGRDLRSEGELTIDDLLPSDRTVRNEVDRAAQHERNLLKIKLVAAADDYRLSISPDIWSDKYRNISYLGATAHFVGDNGIYHYFDLFCSEFKWKNKTALNVLKDA